MNHQLKVWLVAAPLALAMGCSSGTDNPPGETNNDVSGCVSDLECATGQVCVQAVCRVGACNQERTCPRGQTCDTATFTCSGGEPACAVDADCDGIAICRAGECQAVICTQDSHCLPNEECNAQNRCVATVNECVDADGDGFGLGCDRGPDCDDSNAAANPDAEEDAQTNCDDGIDQDCDGTDPRCGALDGDNDGFPEGEDCNDADPAINPGAGETPYNGKDDDCDANTRDDDIDGDGYPLAEDCDDRNVNINPEAPDVPGNGVDEDCDGMDRMPSGEDADNDGFTEAQGDCNDNNAAINPGVDEIPNNGKDDDCNPDTPDGDIDGDGFLAPADCDDNDAAVNPEAEEVHYNGKDDDCNPETADGDRDGDGFNATQVGGNDCNDNAPGINPDGTEVPYNGQDDDCDPGTPDDDLDRDGFNRDEECDDENAMVNPDIVENATTNCGDMVDNDCRGGDVACDPNAVDTDNDGVPDNQDCAPNDPNIPGPAEIPGNGRDDDCDPNTPDEIIACDEDAFDDASPNGSPDTATAVEDGNRLRGQFEALVICGEDQDWYRIDLEAGDGLEVDIRFDADEGDVDMQLARLEDGELIFIDSSAGVGDTETVYERRAPVAATYFISVFRFRPGQGRSPYSMTVNVFEQCTDDQESFEGEHNDFPEQATLLPQGLSRQICDFDDDWYSFTLAQAGTVRLDLLFTDADGDLDLALFRQGEDTPLVQSRGVVDNELIEQMLPAGTYLVRVFGFGGAQNRYRLFRTSGRIDTARETLADTVVIPDFEGGQPGVARVDMTFDVPRGALIRNLRVRDLDINHTFLRDLVVTGLWDDQRLAVMWNRQGDANGGDGGEDDDFLPFTGGDINFDNRDFPQFAGQLATGTFSLLIEDMAIGDEGELVDLDIEIEFLVP